MIISFDIDLVFNIYNIRSPIKILEMQAVKKYEVNTFQRLARPEMTGASALKKKQGHRRPPWYSAFDVYLKPNKLQT